MTDTTEPKTHKGKKRYEMDKATAEKISKLYYDEHVHNARDIKASLGSEEITLAAINGWLQQQGSRQVHAYPVKSKRPMRHMLYAEPWDMAQMDLIDLTGQMKKSKANFVLTFIDCFSRYAYAEPIKDKSAEHVLAALKSIVHSVSHATTTDKDKRTFAIHTIQADNGKEFKNKFVQDYLAGEKIRMRWANAYSPAANGCIERFNGTLKRMLFEAMKANDNGDWVAMLPKVLHSYNVHHVHRMTGETPAAALEPQNSDAIQKRQADAFKKQPDDPDDIDVGDEVRVLLTRKHTDKSYRPQFSDDIYTVRRRKAHHMGLLTYEYEVENKNYSIPHLSRFQLQLVRKSSARKGKSADAEPYQPSRKPAPAIDESGPIPPDHPQKLPPKTDSAPPKTDSAPQKLPVLSQKQARANRNQMVELKNLDMKFDGAKGTPTVIQDGKRVRKPNPKYAN